MSDISPVSPCFTPGTLIATDRGQRPIETLRRGDKVVTRDNGLRRIYWIGRRDLGHDDLRNARRLQPVLVRAGALGEGAPSRDMLVSPNHRFLCELDPIPGDSVCQSEEVLVAARHLIDHKSIRSAQTLGVSYIHLLCDRHQIILANGTWTETFHPDDMVLRALGNAHRLELMELFPDIMTIGASTRFPPARPIVEGRSRFER
ncbi:MAG: Hint domain-containing protein [Silicimonas sp.]